MSLQVDSQVNEDAEIEEMTLEIGVEDSMYSMMALGEEDPIEEFEADMEEHGVEMIEFSDYDVSDRKDEEDDMTYVTMTYYDVVPSESSSIDVYEEDGQIVYEDPEFEAMEIEPGDGAGGLNDFGADPMEEPGFEEDFSADTCFGTSGFIGSDVTVESHEVTDEGFVMDIRNAGPETLELETVVLGGQEFDIDEDIGVGASETVNLDVETSESDSCSYYDLEFDYNTDSFNGQTIAGSIDLGYEIEGSSTQFTGEENDESYLGSLVGAFYEDDHDSLQDQEIEAREEVEDPVMEDLDEMEEAIEDMVTIEYNVHMPGEVVETTGNAEGNLAHYNTSMFMDQELEDEGVYVRSEVDSGIVNSFISWFTGIF